MTVLTRASIFMGGGLMSLLVTGMLALDVSAAAGLGRLRSPLVFLMALMFSIGITGVLGAAVGFRLLPAHTTIPTAALLLLGGIFGLLAFAVFVPVLDSAGIVAGAGLYVLLAATTAFVGGRIFSG